MRHDSTFRWLAAAMLLLGLALLAGAACTGDAESNTGDGDAAASVGDLTVRDVRAPAPAGDTAAVYFTVTNGGEEDDALVGLTTEVASIPMLHRTVTEGTTSRMEMVDAIPVPAGGEAVLEPGGYHAMLVGLQRELPEGATFTVELTFRRAGTVTVEVPVVSRAEAAGGHAAHEPAP